MTSCSDDARFMQINPAAASREDKYDPDPVSSEPLLLQMPPDAFARLSGDGAAVSPLPEPVYQLDNYGSPSPKNIGMTIRSTSYQLDAMPWPSVSMSQVMKSAPGWSAPGTRGLLFNGVGVHSLEADVYVRLIDTALPRVARSGVFAVDPADNRWILESGDLGVFDYIEYDGGEQLQLASRILTDRLIAYVGQPDRAMTITGVIWNVAHRDDGLGPFLRLNDAMERPAEELELPMVGADIFADEDPRTAVSMLVLGKR
ncbi:hypothetical protein [Salinisphaera hydrothermalis]|uniref:hypothetical protein n=1 Tax=Salinisphaera hydrothermalis TaxID=563188 RepID=UPI00333E74C8